MKIIIEVLGGVVNNIIATDDVSIFLIDHDNIKEKGSPVDAKQAFQPDRITWEMDSDDNDTTPIFDKAFDEILQCYEEAS